MDILITGANGFIGHNFCRNLLLRDTFKVCGVDIEESSLKHTSFDFRKLDIREPGFENKLPDNVDVVVHLAQSPLYREFPGGADDMLKVNVNGTFRLLEWARKTGVRKFIFASTGNVYTHSAELLTESHACRAGSFYAATKLSAEQITEQYSKFFSVVILRLFGVYGPGQQNMLIPGLIKKISNQEEIVLAQGKGIILTPLYIDDCIAIITKIAEKEMISGFPLIFNLCGSETVDLGNIVTILSELMNKKAVLRLTDELPMFLSGDNRKIVSYSGFLPIVNIREGLKKTLGI